MVLSTAQRSGDARERLLARLLDAFGDDLPSPGMSLREVAARAQTSHALLRYHFGSLPGVLAAMLTVWRSRDNEALVENAQRGSFDDLVMAIWRVYTRPEQLSRTRAFFHVVGLAAHDPGNFGEFIDSLDDLTTMLASLAEREGHDAEKSVGMATVAIAAVRGLLLREVLAPSVHSEESEHPADAVAMILGMRDCRCAPRGRPRP